MCRNGDRFCNYTNKVFSGTWLAYLTTCVFSLVAIFVIVSLRAALTGFSPGIAIKKFMPSPKCFAPNPSWPIKLLSSRGASSG